MKQIQRIWKVWFRTTRKIRNTTAIITVQGVSQTGRRHNSAVDLSNILGLKFMILPVHRRMLL